MMQAYTVNVGAHMSILVACVVPVKATKNIINSFTAQIVGNKYEYKIKTKGIPKLLR